jgi:hypothetical protein
VEDRSRHGGHCSRSGADHLEKERQSTIILEYLEDKWPRPPLLPASPAERARVRMIEELCDTYYEAVNWAVFEIRAFGRDTGELADRLLQRAAEQIAGANRYLDGQLGSRPFFNGDAFGWGDLLVVPVVHAAAAFTGNPPPAGSALEAWLERLLATGHLLLVYCRSRRALHLPPPLERFPERRSVCVLDVAPHGQTVRDACHTHAEGFDQTGEIDRRRFSLGRRIGGDDDLAHGSVAEPADQVADAKLVGPYAVEGSQGSLQHVIAPSIPARPLDRHEIGGLFDHADHLAAALRIAAEIARIARRQGAANRAGADFLAQLRQGGGQGVNVLAPGANQMEGETGRGFLADSG